MLYSNTISPLPAFWLHILTLRRFELLYVYGDLQLLPEVDHLPHLEVPYPNTNGGQHS